VSRRVDPRSFLVVGDKPVKTCENSCDLVMTGLQRAIAQQLRDGLDPWAGTTVAAARKVSAALGRMNRRGLVVYHRARWHLTAAGRTALQLATPVLEDR
jgi:hypothetical protein